MTVEERKIETLMQGEEFAVLGTWWTVAEPLRLDGPDQRCLIHTTAKTILSVEQHRKVRVRGAARTDDNTRMEQG